jgi:hypothetical protein
VNSYSAQLLWDAPAGTEEIDIYRSFRLLDKLSATATTYLDYLLWPSSSYGYKIVFTGPSGPITTLTTTVTTPAQQGPFPVLYATSSIWNVPIEPGPPIDPRSPAIVAASLTRFARVATLVDSPRNGYPIVYASSLTQEYAVGCTKYDCQTSITFRIPSYARPNAGPDGHLVVLDPSTNRELDLFQGQCCWKASSRYVMATDGWGAVCPLGQHCNGAVAAGFAEAGGIIRPEEIAQGHIDHALVLGTPYTRFGYIACPATHTDGKYSVTAIPEGARIQLDPSLNVQAQRWPRWEKVIARALQVYGGYIADTAGALTVRAESTVNRGYDAWTKAGVFGTDLSALPWSRMRVLKLQPC